MASRGEATGTPLCGEIMARPPLCMEDYSADTSFCYSHVHFSELACNVMQSYVKQRRIGRESGSSRAFAVALGNKSVQEWCPPSQYRNSEWHLNDTGDLLGRYSTKIMCHRRRSTATSTSWREARDLFRSPCL